MILRHELQVHGEHQVRPEDRVLVLVQYVTLEERVYFPVAYDTPLPPPSTFEADLSNKIKASRSPSIDSVDRVSGDGARSVRSAADSTRSYASLQKGAKFHDVYTDAERKDILASLWSNPAPNDLLPLSDRAAGGEIRKLAYRDGDETVQEVRRFKRATIQAILHNQDNIVMLEESMSQGNCSGEAVGRLTGCILDHGLFSQKSYRCGVSHS
jgi:hypothetical protein